MSLRIYGMARSRAVRTLWMAAELDLRYEHVKTDLSETGCKAPAFRAINPNGQIPAIDDDGFRLWESLAINLYLAKKHGGKGLYPKTLEEEAKAWQWTLWVATGIEGQMVVWLLHTQMLAAEKRDPKLAADALEKLRAPFKVLDDHLKAQPYLLGSQFTVADLNVAAVMWRALQMDLKPVPALDAWLRRCWERPAAQAVLKLREQG